MNREIKYINISRENIYVQYIESERDIYIQYLESKRDKYIYIYIYTVYIERKRDKYIYITQKKTTTLKAITLIHDYLVPIHEPKSSPGISFAGGEAEPALRGEEAGTRRAEILTGRRRHPKQSGKKSLESAWLSAGEARDRLLKHCSRQQLKHFKITTFQKLNH